MAVTATTFDSAVDAILVPAQGAGTIIKVVAISMHNNDTTEDNDEVVHLEDGSGGTELYGGANGAIYLPGRGGVFQLSMVASTVPHFTLTANTALYMDLTNGRRISGVVWWTTD